VGVLHGPAQTFEQMRAKNSLAMSLGDTRSVSVMEHSSPLALIVMYAIAASSNRLSRRRAVPVEVLSSR
jgi:hypothetical protein